MPQIVYRGDGEVVVGPYRLIKDQPQEISVALAEHLLRTAENLHGRGLELILETKSIFRRLKEKQRQASPVEEQ